MLRALHVRNYVLIDALDVEFPEGLVIISGQTGAGKSILLGALSLLTGAKADASVISEGAASCVVEGEFSCADPAVDALLAAADVEPDGGNLLVRRVVNATGRSRAFVNDCPVQAALLSELAGRLVDIHSQHDTLLLRDKRYQLSVLDHYAGNGELLQSCGTLFRRVKELERELSEVTEQERRAQAEGEYARASLARLEAAKLVEGEWEELEQEHARLANAEQIKEEIYRVTEADLDAGLKEAGKALSRLARFVPAAADWEQRLSSARLEVADILAELEALDARTDLSGDALERVESRMATLRELMRKHGCETPEALIAVRDALRGSLGEGTALAERREALAAELAAQQRALAAVCARLRAARASAAGGLAATLAESLRFLELDKAVFRVELEPSPVSATGEDSPRFLFSADGRAPVELARCASGGELSRVMLCLKAVLARYAAMPTLFFDEIDSGVSGSAADKMGSMICTMGETMQVFAITHLPQVAAKGRAHYLVSKDAAGASHLRRLTPEERVHELARLLSGSTITPAAIANARALLG